MAHNVHQHLQRGPAVVQLNVGGVLFQTSRETLLKAEAAGLCEMMVNSEDGSLRFDGSGHLFLDSNPRTFEVVLDFMRDGAAALPGTQFELHKLLIDARKFQVHALEAQVLAALSQPSELAGPAHELQAARSLPAAPSGAYNVAFPSSGGARVSPAASMQPLGAGQPSQPAPASQPPATTSAVQESCVDTSALTVFPPKKRRQYFEYAKKEWEEDELFKLPMPLPDGSTHWPIVDPGDPDSEDKGRVLCSLCRHFGGFSQFTSPDGYNSGKKSALVQHQTKNRDHMGFAQQLAQLAQQAAQHQHQHQQPTLGLSTPQRGTRPLRHPAQVTPGTTPADASAAAALAAHAGLLSPLTKFVAGPVGTPAAHAAARALAGEFVGARRHGSAPALTDGSSAATTPALPVAALQLFAAVGEDHMSRLSASAAGPAALALASSGSLLADAESHAQHVQPPSSAAATPQAAVQQAGTGLVGESATPTAALSSQPQPMVWMQNAPPPGKVPQQSQEQQQQQQQPTVFSMLPIPQCLSFPLRDSHQALPQLQLPQQQPQGPPPQQPQQATPQPCHPPLPKQSLSMCLDHLFVSCAAEPAATGSAGTGSLAPAPLPLPTQSIVPPTMPPPPAQQQQPAALHSLPQPPPQQDSEPHFVDSLLAHHLADSSPSMATGVVAEEAAEAAEQLSPQQPCLGRQPQQPQQRGNQEGGAMAAGSAALLPLQQLQLQHDGAAKGQVAGSGGEFMLQLVPAPGMERQRQHQQAAAGGLGLEDSILTASPTTSSLLCSLLGDGPHKSSDARTCTSELGQELEGAGSAVLHGQSTLPDASSAMLAPASLCTLTASQPISLPLPQLPLPDIGCLPAPLESAPAGVQPLAALQEAAACPDLGGGLLLADAAKAAASRGLGHRGADGAAAPSVIGSGLEQHGMHAAQLPDVGPAMHEGGEEEEEGAESQLHDTALLQLIHQSSIGASLPLLADLGDFPLLPCDAT